MVALGFEGGHGTAAGLRQTFIDLGYPEGADLALFTASVSGQLCHSPSPHTYTLIKHFVLVVNSREPLIVVVLCTP